MTTRFTYPADSEMMRIARAETTAHEMPWLDIMAGIAQGAINITEGLTTIERGSRVHLAMLALCERFTAIQEGREGLPPQFKASAAHLAGYCPE